MEDSGYKMQLEQVLRLLTRIDAGQREALRRVKALKTALVVFLVLILLGVGSAGALSSRSEEGPPLVQTTEEGL